MNSESNPESNKLPQLPPEYVEKLLSCIISTKKVSFRDVCFEQPTYTPEFEKAFEKEEKAIFDEMGITIPSWYLEF